MQVDLEDFIRDVKKQEEILVLFYAEWCPYCTRFKPLFTEIAKQRKTICGTVDISNEENLLWEKLKIDAVPTVILYRKGKLIDRVTGGLDMSELKAFMKRNKLM